MRLLCCSSCRNNQSLELDCKRYIPSTYLCHVIKIIMPTPFLMWYFLVQDDSSPIGHNGSIVFHFIKINTIRFYLLVKCYGYVSNRVVQVICITWGRYMWDEWAIHRSIEPSTCGTLTGGSAQLAYFRKLWCCGSINQACCRSLRKSESRFLLSVLTAFSWVMDRYFWLNVHWSRLLLLLLVLLPLRTGLACTIDENGDGEQAVYDYLDRRSMGRGPAELNFKYQMKAWQK